MGMRNAIQATASRKISKDPFLLSTTLIFRLSRPCGARIATIATVATRIATFANHGFVALPHCPHYIACLANVNREPRAAARWLHDLVGIRFELFLPCRLPFARI